MDRQYEKLTSAEPKFGAGLWCSRCGRLIAFDPDKHNMHTGTHIADPGLDLIEPADEITAMNNGWRSTWQKQVVYTTCTQAPKRTAASVLKKAADTYLERNAVYGDNFKQVAPLVRTLFPNGVPKDVIHGDSWHLFELILVKLSRFANSNLQHKDSIHDTVVYAAMIEAIIDEEADDV